MACGYSVLQLIATPAAGKMAICERLSDRLFGTAFRLSPIIQLTNAAAVTQARTTDLSKNLDLLSLETWQCQSALVHPVFRIYRQCALLREALAAPTAGQALTIIQFNSPTAPPGFWVGAEMRGAPPNTDVSQDFGGTLSLALEVQAAWNPTQILSGLVFDEWTEMLPAREATSGVAFHFNQPDTEPPQAMLLAVCPAEGEIWRWEYLSETILDAFERAKRLVHFDHLTNQPRAGPFAAGSGRAYGVREPGPDPRSGTQQHQYAAGRKRRGAGCSIVKPPNELKMRSSVLIWNRLEPQPTKQ